MTPSQKSRDSLLLGLSCVSEKRCRAHASSASFIKYLPHAHHIILLIHKPQRESMGGSSCDERTPPLKVVLGAFGGGSSKWSSEPSLSSTTLAASAAGGGGGGSPSSPVAHILGTSYFATPRLLGANNNGGNNPRRSSVSRLNKDGRVPMEDRKGPFDHFRPKSLMLSVSLSFLGVHNIRDIEKYTTFVAQSHTKSNLSRALPPPPEN